MSTRDIEKKFFSVCFAHGVKKREIDAIRSFLEPLRDKSSTAYLHYLHSLRVGLLAAQIAPFLHLNEVPLLFAGALHDLKKCRICGEALGTQAGWSDADRVQYIMDGYSVLRGTYELSAEIIRWHHRFQEDGYPKILPSHFYGYTEANKQLVVEYGRIMALADLYDVLNNVNAKFSTKKPLNGMEIREKILQCNPDKEELILDLYGAGVFTL